jgi:geranyl diphosphate synthase
LIGESTDIVTSELRVRQRGIAEITEMIHVSNYSFTHNIH